MKDNSMYGLNSFRPKMAALSNDMLLPLRLMLRMRKQSKLIAYAASENPENMTRSNVSTVSPGPAKVIFVATATPEMRWVPNSLVIFPPKMNSIAMWNKFSMYFINHLEKLTSPR